VRSTVFVRATHPESQSSSIMARFGSLMANEIAGFLAADSDALICAIPAAE